MTSRAPLLRKGPVLVMASTVLLIVSCIWLLAAVVVQQQRVDRLVARIDAVRAEAVFYQRVQRILPIGMAPEHVASLRTALDRRLSQERILGELQDLARRNDVQVIRESFNKPLSLREGYARMDLDLELSGNYRQLVAFLAACQDAYFVATYRQLSLVPAERGGGVVAQVGLSLFGVLPNGT